MPKPLHIQATESTPEVFLDTEKQIFLISGDILPENSYELFNPIFKWFEEYLKNPDKEMTVEFSINIINTSSTRRLVYLFKIFEKISDSGNRVTVIWRHLPDDEIMQYTAYEFGNAFSKINFETKLK